MTLLDRFRTQPGQHHPDPTVRLAFVEEIPIDARDTLAAIALDDEDARVRRAAVAKLLDPSVLGRVARGDADDEVRQRAHAMLRDIALEAFEGLHESDSLEAIDAVDDQRILGEIARSATREIVALRALSRVTEARALGSVARHADLEAARQHAFAELRDRNEQAELVAVAMNSDHKDTAVAAVDLVTDRATLESIEARSRNRSAVKRARVLMREADEQAAMAARDVEQAAAEAAALQPRTDAERSVPVELPATSPTGEGPAAGASPGAADTALDAVQEEPRPVEEGVTIRRHARLADLCEAAVAAADDEDLARARKSLSVVRREWRHVAEHVDPELQARFDEAVARVAARETVAKEAEVRARREALARLHHLLGRAEALVAKGDLTLKAAERIQRDLRTALDAVPPLPSREDYDDVTSRLKSMQALLMPKLVELREAADWQRFTNAGIQERLCAKMEALRDVDDPDRIAREVRDLQQQWRQAADVPRAQADALWRRFKAAHDEVWTRAEGLFATQAEARRVNLEKKVDLCAKAESMADSTQWIQTAEDLKALQADWKAIGPVTRGAEKAVWDRFRSACDRFFKRRHEDLASRRKTWAENLAKKEALCERAEALAESTEWDKTAAELKRLQSEWRMIGPVKKSRSEAVWQRFRSACDRFFERAAARHDTARAERIAAREAIVAELEDLGGADEGANAPPDLIARVRGLRTRWQQEIAARGVDPERARALDARFTAAQSALVTRWPAAFAGTELDPQANLRRMETLVKRVEELATSLAGPQPPSTGDAPLSPTSQLAAMLKEALAANTIGGRADEDGRRRVALEEMRQAQAAWARLGPVEASSDETRRALASRFQEAVQRIAQRAASASPAAKGAPSKSKGPQGWGDRDRQRPPR